MFTSLGAASVHQPWGPQCSPALGPPVFTSLGAASVHQPWGPQCSPALGPPVFTSLGAASVHQPWGRQCSPALGPPVFTSLGAASVHQPWGPQCSPALGPPVFTSLGEPTVRPPNLSIGQGSMEYCATVRGSHPLLPVYGFLTVTPSYRYPQLPPHLENEPWRNDATNELTGYNKVQQRKKLGSQKVGALQYYQLQ